MQTNVAIQRCLSDDDATNVLNDKDGNPGKYDSHIVNEYLTRIVHKKFHDEFVKPDFG